MLYVSILTSNRNLDPELWAVIWQANMPIELRKGALESPTREAARRHAREWIAAREKASDNS